MGPILAGAEDPEMLEIQALKRLFSAVEGDVKNFYSYLTIELEFVTRDENDNQIKIPLKLDKDFRCPLCKGKNNPSLILNRQPTAFKKQLYDLFATIRYRLNYAEIYKRIKNGKLNQYDALKQFRALELASIKRKERGTSNVNGTINDVKCECCRQIMGFLRYNFSTNSKLPPVEEVTWNDIEKLEKPPPEIWARIAMRLRVHPGKLDDWVKAKWGEELKKEIHDWRDRLTSIEDVHPNINYQIIAFLGDIESEIEETVKRRRTKFREAFENAITEDLRDLSSKW